MASDQRFIEHVADQASLGRVDEHPLHYVTTQSADRIRTLAGAGSVDRRHPARRLPSAVESGYSLKRQTVIRP